MQLTKAKTNDVGGSGVWSHEVTDGPCRHAALALTDDPERARAIAGRLAIEAVARLDMRKEARP